MMSLHIIKRIKLVLIIFNLLFCNYQKTDSEVINKNFEIIKNNGGGWGGAPTNIKIEPSNYYYFKSLALLRSHHENNDELELQKECLYEAEMVLKGNFYFYFHIYRMLYGYLQFNMKKNLRKDYKFIDYSYYVFSQLELMKCKNSIFNDSFRCDCVFYVHFPGGHKQAFRKLLQFYCGYSEEKALTMKLPNHLTCEE